MIAEQLETWVKAVGLEQPFIIAGPSEHSEPAVLHAARLIVCTTKNGCGVCLACQQATTFIHPDIVRVMNDDDLVTDQTISIKAIRALLLRLSRTPLAGRQLFIIPQAERLPVEATNALLKALEELSATTRMLLTTQFPLRLLPTLRSRSRIIYTGPATATAPASIEAVITLIDSRAKGALSAQELATITGVLEMWLHTYGTTPALARAFLRLRDYYKIQSSRGNQSLAADVLVASVAYVRNTIK